MRHRRERATAIGHDLAVGSQFRRPLPKLVERIERAPSIWPAANSSSGRTSTSTTSPRRSRSISSSRPIASTPRRVLARRALDLGQRATDASRSASQTLSASGPRARSARSCPRAPRHHARRMQRLQVLGGVRHRLLARLSSSSTVLGAWASRSSNSRRRGLANALPINAIASNSASFSHVRSRLTIQ